MKIVKLEKFFHPLRNKRSPLTDRLIKGGYQQKDGGYITYAKEKNILIDYKKASPKQSWHFFESYCARSKPDDEFTKQVQCGELILWMAEISKAVSRKELKELVNTVLIEPTNRVRGNKLIQDKCFDAIVAIIENKDMLDNALSNMYSVVGFFISTIFLLFDLLFKPYLSIVFIAVLLVASIFFCRSYQNKIKKEILNGDKDQFVLINKFTLKARIIGYLSYGVLGLAYLVKIFTLLYNEGLISKIIDFITEFR